jgi:type I restriction enzyme S subunit
LFPDSLDPILVSHFINSWYGRLYIASVVSQQVGQANVNGSKLAAMPIPLPPPSEQSQIIAEIERRFAVADRVEETVAQGIAESQRLRQSILKRAFSGRLVPQDPKDEPADKLLERIRAARDSAGARQPRRRVSVRHSRERASDEG